MAAGTTTALFMLSGLIVGIISGILGIGGGVLIIPALVVLFRFPHERAVGTSLGMLLPPIGIFAFLEYWRHGNVDLTAAALLAGGFAVGAYFGGVTVNARLVHPETPRLLFAFLLLYIAGSIIFAHSDHTVWAVVKTVGLMFIFAITYVVAKVVGRRLERRFVPREAFVLALQESLAPDYEI